MTAALSRSRLKRRSAKTAALHKSARELRINLIKAQGRCEICGHRPKAPWPEFPPLASTLCCHEIACGKNRLKALDKPYAILVLCWLCNAYFVTDKKRWPEARQLAVLKKQRPRDYDLVAYNALVNPKAPNRITQEEVDQWAANTTM